MTPARIGIWRTVCLGLSQLIGWGATHYLIATFGTPIAADLGLSPTEVQSGFALALVTMGLVSPAAGRWIDRYGGRRVLIAGCGLGTFGVALLAGSHHLAQYLAAWALIGLAMRLCLYDAAFAALAGSGAGDTRRAMAAITLFGGLASTVFWPLAGYLNATLGWRDALLVHAALLAASALLHMALPGRSAGVARGSGAVSAVPVRQPPIGQPRPEPLPQAASPARSAALLQPGIGRADIVAFALIAVLTIFLQNSIAAHLINLLTRLGANPREAILWASLMGIGQISGRLLTLALAERIHAIRLNLLPGLLMLVAMLLALAADHWPLALPAFVFLYGAGNGIATITRGTVPLALFTPHRYGEAVGRILRPALLLSASSPVAMALLIELAGARGFVLAGIALVLAIVLASARLLRSAAGSAPR